MHCAGDVSFDPPVDEGFRTNVVGTRDLLDRIREAGGDIHYVHISTAYVARAPPRHHPRGPGGPHGRRRGRAGLGSRPAPRRRAPVPQHGGADQAALRGPSASTAEPACSPRRRPPRRRRREWVKEQLVRIGTERARSLGWTDCYTFTKSLGERVVEEYAADRAGPSIVRPSIIESALVQPYPGWIEGFKMAEPLILAYGRGELPEFPAAGGHRSSTSSRSTTSWRRSWRSCAHPPEPGEPAYFHVSSGARNPLTFRRLHQSCPRPTSTSTRSRWTTAARSGCRTGGSPAPRASSGCSRRARRRTRSPTTSSAARPRSDRTRDLARKLDQQGRRLEFLRRYLDLYREYAEAELRFDDAHTLALLPRARRRRPGAVRLRHRGRRLGLLPPRRALPRRHRADRASTT